MGIESLLFSDPTMAFLKRTLDVHDYRSRVIASNLANVDTPGYKALNLDFRKALDEAQNRLAQSAALTRTNPRHLGGDDAPDMPVEEIETEDQSIRVDANTVDQDGEMQKLAETQTFYSAAATALAKKGRIVGYALSGRV
jgi:flagellar basal-body rod protein FlgB